MSGEVVDAPSHLYHSATAHRNACPGRLLTALENSQTACENSLNWSEIFVCTSPCLGTLKNSQATGPLLVTTQVTTLGPSTWSLFRWLEDLKWLMSWSFVSKVRLSLDAHAMTRNHKTELAPRILLRTGYNGRMDRKTQFQVGRVPDAALSPTWSFLACGITFVCVCVQANRNSEILD